MGCAVSQEIANLPRNLDTITSGIGDALRIALWRNEIGGNEPSVMLFAANFARLVENLLCNREKLLPDFNASEHATYNLISDGIAAFGNSVSN